MMDVFALMFEKYQLSLPNVKSDVSVLFNFELLKWGVNEGDPRVPRMRFPP